MKTKKTILAIHCLLLSVLFLCACKSFVGVKVVDKKGKPVGNMGVYIVDSGVAKKMTSDSGFVVFKIHKKRIKNEKQINLIPPGIPSHLTFKRKLFGVRRVKKGQPFPIEKINLIRLDNYGARDSRIRTLDSLSTELTNIIRLLDSTELKLGMMEKKTSKYLYEHPNPSMEMQMKRLLDKRRKENINLKQEIKNMITVVENAMSNADGDDLSDEDFAKIIESCEKLDKALDEHKVKVELTDNVIDKNIDMGDALKISITEYYFSSGQYSISELPKEQKQNLDEFCDEISTIITNKFPVSDIKEIELFVHGTGYTDGVELSDEKWNEIKSLCDPKMPRGDGNDCLSKLRAQAMVEYFHEVIIKKNYSIIPFSEGKGSLGASTGKEDPNKRRCVVSLFVSLKAVE